MASLSSRPSRSDRRVGPGALLAGLAAATLLFVVAPAPASDGPADFELIVSADVPVKSLSFEEVQRLFRFQRRFWQPGRPVSVVLPAPGTEAHRFLLKRVLRSTDGALHRAIVEKLYRGELDLAPKTAASDAEALGMTSSGAGLVTIVSAGAPRPPGARVVAVNDRRPGDPDYLLRD